MWHRPPACERLLMKRLSAENRQFPGLSKQVSGDLPTTTTN